MEYAIVGLLVVGVVYFVVHKLGQKKAAGTSSAGRPRDGVKTHEK